MNGKMCITNIDNKIYGILKMLIKGALFIIFSINEILFIFMDSFSKLIIRFSYFNYYEHLLTIYNCILCDILVPKKNLIFDISFEVFTKKTFEIFIEFIPDNSHTG